MVWNAPVSPTHGWKASGMPSMKLAGPNPVDPPASPSWEVAFWVKVVTEPQPSSYLFFFQAEDGIRVGTVTGVQTCALPISYIVRPARSSSLNLSQLSHCPTRF